MILLHPQLPSTQKNSWRSGPLRIWGLFLCDHLPPRPGLAGKRRPKNPEQVVTPRQLRILPLPHTLGEPFMDSGAKDAGNAAGSRKQKGPLPIITQDGAVTSFLNHLRKCCDPGKDGRPGQNVGPGLLPITTLQETTPISKCIHRKPGASQVTRPYSVCGLVPQSLVWSGGWFCPPTPLAAIRRGAWEAAVFRVEDKRLYFTQLFRRQGVIFF